jgi:hypothetical protein
MLHLQQQETLRRTYLTTLTIHHSPFTIHHSPFTINVPTPTHRCVKQIMIYRQLTGAYGSLKGEKG